MDDLRLFIFPFTYLVLRISGFGEMFFYLLNAFGSLLCTLSAYFLGEG